MELLSYKNQVLDVPSTLPWPCVLLTRLLCVIYLFNNLVFFSHLFFSLLALFFAQMPLSECPLLFATTNGWFFYEARIGIPPNTHRLHWGERNSCGPAASISGTRTSRRPASGPTLSGGSSRQCPGGGWPGTSGPRCRCTNRRSGCVCRDAGSRTPAKGVTQTKAIKFVVWFNVIFVY